MGRQGAMKPDGMDTLPTASGQHKRLAPAPRAPFSAERQRGRRTSVYSLTRRSEVRLRRRSGFNAGVAFWAVRYPSATLTAFSGS